MLSGADPGGCCLQLNSATFTASPGSWNPRAGGEDGEEDGEGSRYRKCGPAHYCGYPWLAWVQGEPQSCSCPAPMMGSGYTGCCAQPGTAAAAGKFLLPTPAPFCNPLPCCILHRSKHRKRKTSPLQSLLSWPDADTQRSHSCLFLARQQEASAYDARLRHRQRWVGRFPFPLPTT